VRGDAAGAPPPPGRRGAGDSRAAAGRPRRVPRMARGVEGAGAPWSVGPALGTERPPAVAQSPGAVVSGHRAHGGSDAADRWGEAVGASRGGPRSARPPPRPTRTTTEDAAHRRHRAAHAPRLPTAYLSAGPHGRHLPPRVPRLPPPHRLWPCTRCLPSTVPPSRRRGAAAGPPIAGVRRGRPRRQDDATNGARSTGGGLRASACP